jgi:hypothetical protein
VKLVIFFVIFALLVLASCTPTDYNGVARKSEPFRLLLLKYYVLKGHFPDDPNSLKDLDPIFSLQGGLWNGWAYAPDDADAYQIFIYPGRTRQSLWLKFDVKTPPKTGWFINNDDGNFQRQTIPLMPQEQDLLRNR